MTIIDDATPTPSVPFAESTRMYAQRFPEIEGQETDDAAAWSAARRVVALLDAPAPADPPDSDTITVRSVEALAAVYGLLADAESGLIYITDPDGRQWAVGTHRRAPILMAWAKGNLLRSLPELFANGPVVLRGARQPVHRGAELAARIMSLLLLHGIRATATTYEDQVTVWNSLERTTSPEWVQRAAEILRTHYGVQSDPSNGSLEIDLGQFAPTAEAVRLEPRKITDPAELDALPLEAVLVDPKDRAWQLVPGFETETCWTRTNAVSLQLSSDELIETYGWMTLVHTPVMEGR